MNTRPNLLHDPQARCARCGGPFHCGVNDPEPCACTGIAVSPDTLLSLREQYTGCLCLACLASLARQAEASTAPTARPA